MSSPIVMFDPQGKLRDISPDQVDSATKAGGEPAVLFDAPDGKQRWVRQSQKDQAIQSGGKVHQDSLSQQWDKLTAPLTEIQKPDSSKKYNPSEAVKAVGNIGAGGLGLALHPVNTLASMGGMLTAVPEMIAGKPFSQTVPGEMVQQFVENPYGTAEGMVGAAGATGALEKVPEVVGDLAKRGAQLVTKTSPKMLTKEGGLVPETQAANAKALEAQNIEAQKAAARSKINDLSRELQGRIESARTAALKVGNEKYSAVNEALDPKEADMDSLQTSVLDSLQNIKGTEKGVQGEPPIIKEVNRRIGNGDALTYRDLQGFYSELGKELSKGTLPGDVYKAYDVLHDAIADQMQGIAKRADEASVLENGEQTNYLGQLSDAQNYWRKMKQTFGRPTPIRDAATKVFMSVTPEFAKADILQNRLRLLSDYDPEIANVADQISQGRETLKSLPKQKPNATQMQTISPEDIQQAKAEQLGKDAASVWSKGIGAVTTLGLYRGLSQFYHQNLGAVGSLAAESTMAGAGAWAITKVLENERVVKALTKPTPRDVAAIPPDLARDMEPVIEAAKAKGIKVSPALQTAVSAASSSRWYNIQDQH